MTPMRDRAVQVCRWAMACLLMALACVQAAQAAIPKVFRIEPGPSAAAETLKAIFYASEGDTVEFAAGAFSFPSSLIIHGKRGLTIRGAGKDKTRRAFSTAKPLKASMPRTARASRSRAWRSSTPRATASASTARST